MDKLVHNVRKTTSTSRGNQTTHVIKSYILISSILKICQTLSIAKAIGILAAEKTVSGI